MKRSALGWPWRRSTRFAVTLTLSMPNSMTWSRCSRPHSTTPAGPPQPRQRPALLCSADHPCRSRPADRPPTSTVDRAVRARRARAGRGDLGHLPATGPGLPRSRPSLWPGPDDRTYQVRQRRCPSLASAQASPTWWLRTPRLHAVPPRRRHPTHLPVGLELLVRSPLNSARRVHSRLPELVTGTG